jgi:pSer/pThr/pTyr-binding forkhead associated (FHA) protein
LFEQPDEVFLQPEELFSDPADLAEHVIVSEDDESGEPVRYLLLQDEMTIGRSRKSDIRINSKYISRLHAKIKVEDGRATIEDAGSTNGFLVNSEHSTCHTLAHGDKLEIGKNKFQYLVLSQT